MNTYMNEHGVMIREWPCSCGAIVSTVRGDTECTECEQPYNAFGQRLRRDWRSNPSLYSEDIGDLEGYELQYADY